MIVFTIVILSKCILNNTPCVVGRLSQIAEKHGASIPQVAISWILVKPHVSAVLVGASKIDQLRDNRGVAHVELGKDDTVELII